MRLWRLQSSKHPLINSEGARITGGPWNQPGTPVIYASENTVLAALEVIVHHGGIPHDYACIQIDVPDDVEIGDAGVPLGWPDLVPEEVTATHGTEWASSGAQAILRVPSATMSSSGYNYVLNPAHPDFARLTFTLVPMRFDARLRAQSS